jgi:hypothetical protein
LKSVIFNAAIRNTCREDLWKGLRVMLTLHELNGS